MTAEGAKSRYVVGMGANLGDRLLNLRSAAAAIDADRYIQLLARSAVYETAPVGPKQDDFLNAALLIETGQPPEKLLARLLDIERQLGRRRPDPIRWGPRTIDLDVLWRDSGSFQAEGLTIPHPRLGQRPFALIPMLDVAPDAVDPASGAPYASFAAASSRIGQLDVSI